MGVDVEPALGVKQRAGYFDRVIRRLQWPLGPGFGRRRTAGRAGVAGPAGAFAGCQHGCGVRTNPCGQHRRIGTGFDGASRLGRHKIRKAACQRQDRLIKHIPGHAAGLGQHLHRRLRVAAGLIMKALAVGIELYAALHHQRPADQCAVRRGPGAVALVAAQVGQPGAQGAAPGNGAAVVAGVPGKRGVAHLRQQLAHHGGVAAKAVAGQHQQLTAQVLQLAVGPLKTQTGNALLLIHPQGAHRGFGQQVGAGGPCRLFELGHQRCAGFLRHGVHAPQAVAGVQKTV